jgi:hypothetical protein
MKSSVKTTKKINLPNNSETRNKELLYMSQYMALVMNKEKLITLKLTG